MDSFEQALRNSNWRTRNWMTFRSGRADAVLSRALIEA